MALVSGSFITYGGSGWLLEIDSCRNGLCFFRATRCSNLEALSKKDTHKLSHSFYLNGKDHIIVQYYTYEKVNNLKRLKKNFLKVHKELYNSIYNAAMKAEASKFTFSELYKHAANFNSKSTMNGVDLFIPDYKLSVDKLYDLTCAVYIIAFIKRYDSSNIVATIINEIKNDRELESKTFMSKILDLCVKKITRSNTLSNIRFAITTRIGLKKLYTVEQLDITHTYTLDEIKKKKRSSTFSEAHARNIAHAYDTGRQTDEAAPGLYEVDRSECVAGPSAPPTPDPPPQPAKHGKMTVVPVRTVRTVAMAFKGFSETKPPKSASLIAIESYATNSDRAATQPYISAARGVWPATCRLYKSCRHTRPPTTPHTSTRPQH